jgi:hypothetical protein
VYKIHLYYVCHITYNKNENMREINAFSKYFSITGSGNFFGPFQEYRKKSHVYKIYLLGLPDRSIPSNSNFLTFF